MPVERGGEFDALHKRIWRDLEMAGLPLPYREEVNSIAEQATLVVLTTMENIELLRLDALKTEGKYNPDEQVIAFCKSMHSLSPGRGEDGSVQRLISMVATDQPVTDYTESEWSNLKRLKESLARSQPKQDITTGPFKTSWGKD